MIQKILKKLIEANLFNVDKKVIKTVYYLVQLKQKTENDLLNAETSGQLIKFLSLNF